MYLPSCPVGTPGRGAAIVIACLVGTLILAGSPGHGPHAESPGTSPSSTRMSAPEPNVDRPGFDYRNFPMDSGWQGCASQCAEEEACWSWTFVKPPVEGGVGHCWLKSAVADARRDDGCVSGVKAFEGAALTGRQAMVGRWRWFNGATVDCDADGTCTASNGYSGSWRNLEGEGRFEIRWGLGGQPAEFMDTLKISPDGMRLSGTNQFGSGVGATRMAAPATALTDETPKASARVGPEAPGGDEEPRAGAETGADRANALEDRGPPDTFLIMFLALETPSGDAVVRQEHWRYYGEREELVFVDGTLVAKADLEPLPDGYTLPGYSPDGFESDMAFDKVAELLGIRSFVMEEILDEEGDMAELYWARQIALGFSNGRLVYAESMPANVSDGAP